jgi:hypothetical protein
VIRVGEAWYALIIRAHSITGEGTRYTRRDTQRGPSVAAPDLAGSLDLEVGSVRGARCPGTVQCYAPGMTAGAADRVQLESELHNAIAMRQFELYY